MEQTKLTLETIIEVVRVKQEVMERPVEYKTGMISSAYAGESGIREIGDEASEVVLNMKNEINAIHRVFAGSLNTSVAHPREIFRTAIINNSARIMLFHNHPSGDTQPSEADFAFTRRIVDCGEMLGIEVIDHVIIADNEYLSLIEQGLM